MTPIAATAAASLSVLAAVTLTVLGVAVLGWRRAALTTTTLGAVWSWSLVTLMALGATEILVALQAESRAPWTTSLRFAAAMSAFCPTMSLLGARRPQDRAWQFIVLSLWAILSLPSFEWLLYGGAEEIHPARFWFLVALVGTGALNGLATRFWLSSLLFCCGQLLVLAPYLSSGQPQSANAWSPLAGLALMIASWTLRAVGLPRGAAARSPLDRVWLDFRDAFGVAWGLRVAERLNASAAMYSWPVTLTWQGFRGRQEGTSDIPPAAVEEGLRGLLRRFVSPEWIDSRLTEFMLADEPRPVMQKRP